MEIMENDDASDCIGSRENALYLLAELERACERGGAAWATPDVDRFQKRLARITVRLAEMCRDAGESFSVAHPVCHGDQRGDVSSVMDGSSPKIDR